jgi:hypothetical protein
MDITPLRAIWALGSYEPQIPPESGLRHWLSQDNYYVDSISSAKMFQLACRDRAEFRSAMAFEAIKFSLNCQQTLFGIRSINEFPRISAWHLIQAYYAAFFASHSTLRLFGRAFSQLETGHVDHISFRAASEAAIFQKLEKGHFDVQFDENQATVRFAHGGESHKGLWKCYVNLLKYVSTKVLQVRGNSRTLHEISTQFSGLETLLRSGGGRDSGNWLSIIRNEVNYRGPDAVWFPFSKNKTQSEDLFRKSSAWRLGQLTPMDCLIAKTEYEKFFMTCVLVCQFNIHLMDDYCDIVDKKHPSIKNFIKYRNLTRENFLC